MRFCRVSLRRGGVLGIGRIVVSLFCRCITFCKECNLYSRLQFHSNVTKHRYNFLVRSAFQTSDHPELLNAHARDGKTCPFIFSVEKLSGPKRSIKITDHFTCTSANVIYCITNRSLDTLVCPIILSNIWQFAASPYIQEARKAAKL